MGGCCGEFCFGSEMGAGDEPEPMFPQSTPLSPWRFLLLPARGEKVAEGRMRGGRLTVGRTSRRRHALLRVDNVGNSRKVHDDSLVDLKTTYALFGFTYLANIFWYLTFCVPMLRRLVTVRILICLLLKISWLQLSRSCDQRFSIEERAVA